MYSPDALLSLSDEELLNLMRSGNERAFATLYERYWEPLYVGAGKRLGNTPEAQDIVQDIMESIWIKRLELSTKGGSLAPYLFTLLKYRIIDTLAHTRQQEICYHAFGQLLILQKHHVLEGLISKELQATIDREIAAMPINMQKVIQLSRLDDHSVAEIANRLSLSEQTVRNLLSQALQRLKICVTHFYSETPSHSHAVFMAATILLLRL
jgi:RNA polymerase sigma factor (sigma-70 family)